MKKFEETKPENVRHGLAHFDDSLGVHTHD